MSPTAKKKSAPAKAKPAKVQPAKAAKAAPKPQPKAKEAKAASAAPVAPASNRGVNVLVWLKAKKGKEVALARALKALSARSRAENGCLTFDLHRSQDHPGDFFIHEIWSSEADLANHRLMPHFQYWVGLQGAILDSRRRYLAE